jgi:hypothetical protein
MGIGLMFRRKSAALIFVVSSFIWAVWFSIATARHVPMPWALIDVMLVLALLIPAGLVVKYWNNLRGW